MFISVWDFLAASFGKIHADREVARAWYKSATCRRSGSALISAPALLARRGGVQDTGCEPAHEHGCAWFVADRFGQPIGSTDGGQTPRPHPEERRRRVSKDGRKHRARGRRSRRAHPRVENRSAKWVGESPIVDPRHCGWRAFPATADDIRAGTAQ
jgi:hypothetical protein